jgi:uncharacterized membrane protein YfcA
MALGIGVAGTMRDVFNNGVQAGIESLPTLIVVILGGMVGGYTAAKLQKHLAERAKN